MHKQIGPKVRFGLITIGLFGASLFFGDGIITPAISVLSAVEGLSVATPIFTPYVIPITIVILIGLFYPEKGNWIRRPFFWTYHVTVVFQ